MSLVVFAAGFSLGGVAGFSAAVFLGLFAKGRSLCIVAQEGNLSEVKRLLGKGANVNYEHKSGYYWH